MNTNVFLIAEPHGGQDLGGQKFLEILISLKKWPLGCCDTHTSSLKVFDSFFYSKIDSEKKILARLFLKIHFFTK